MAWSPSWAFITLSVQCEVVTLKENTEPCCLPSARHLKQQSVHFLPEISPVVETFKQSLSWRHLSRASLRRTVFLLGHKEKQLVLVITWEGTKPLFFLSHAGDHNLRVLKYCLNKSWLVGRCSADTSQWTSSRTQEKSNLFRSSSQHKQLQSICQVKPNLIYLMIQGNSIPGLQTACLGRRVFGA